MFERLQKWLARRDAAPEPTPIPPPQAGGGWPVAVGDLVICHNDRWVFAPPNPPRAGMIYRVRAAFMAQSTVSHQFGYALELEGVAGAYIASSFAKIEHERTPANSDFTQTMREVSARVTQGEG